MGGAGRRTGILRTLPHAVSTLPLPSGLRSLTSHLPGVLTIVPRQGLTWAHVPWWLPAPLFQEGRDANKEALFFSDGQGPREPASSPPASILEGPSKPASSPHTSIQERASAPLRPTGTPQKLSCSSGSSAARLPGPRYEDKDKRFLGKKASNWGAERV